MPKSSDECEICGQDWRWHQDNRPKHIFQVVGEEAVPNSLPGAVSKNKDKPEKAEKAKLQVRQQPTDLGLRIAMIRKGLLTPAEIAAGDTELREAIESGNIIVVGVPDQRVPAGPSDNPQPSSGNDPVGDRGSTPRGLRSSDWAVGTLWGPDDSEAQEHLGEPSELSDRHDSDDGRPAEGDGQGGVPGQGDGVAQPPGRKRRAKPR